MIFSFILFSLSERIAKFNFLRKQGTMVKHSYHFILRDGIFV